MGDFLMMRRRSILSQPHLVTESGNFLSWSKGEKAPIRATVQINPVQSGAGDPSPDNIRPIAGWTGANVTGTGKNLFDSSILSESTAWTIVSLPLPPGTYTMSTDLPSDSTLVLYFKRNGQSQGSSTRVYSGHPVTLYSSSRNFEVSFRRTSGSAVFSGYHFQLEKGSAATAYEPYSGTTTPADWTTEAGTVYGGTVDLTAGVLTVTDAAIASYNGETLPGEWISDRDVYAPGTSPTTGAQVVYELVTPITCQLAPATLTSLRGANNLWAECGPITASYWEY